MQQNHINTLNNSALFGGLSPEITHLLIENSQVITKTKNQYFFKENDIADSMYILLNGEVNIQKQWRGKSYQISHLMAGDCFGEMAMIDHNTRSASVIAHNICQALEFDIECFNQVYQHDLKQYTMLQMNMGREVSRRLREANELLFQANIKNDLLDNIYHIAT